MSTDKIYNNLKVQLDRLHRHNRQGSYKTRERYYEAMKRFCRFLAERYRLEKLANIGSKHIESYTGYMKDKGSSASTIKTELSAIRFWHDQMPGAKNRIPANADLKLERRSIGKIDRTWSDAEFHRMIAVCWKYGREDYAAIICLARHAGLRIHECFRIDTAAARDAVRDMSITVKGKNGKVRSVPIQETIRIELGKMLAATKPGRKLFVPDAMRTDQAIKALQRFIIAHRDEAREPDSDRPMTFHGLRHTYAVSQYTSLIGKGYSESQACKQVSLWLGHEREEITRIYLASLFKGGDADV